MNSCQKYFSACLLALLSQAAFAADVPSLGAASDFAVLSARPIDIFGDGGAVACTRSTITGDVGSSGLSDSVTQTNCTITGVVIAPVSNQVLTDFNSAYDALALTQCDHDLGGNLGGVTLDQPGVYCVDAASTTTDGTLTLSGPSNGIWIFKIGNSGNGSLTGTSFSVVMQGGGQACNVYWWVAEDATMTTSDFKGTILAGSSITTTTSTPPGAFEGRALARGKGVTLTDVAFVGCEGGSGGGKPKSKCNQGVGNGPENCDPGNSNQGDASRSNDELGGIPGFPGRKGGNK